MKYLREVKNKTKLRKSNQENIESKIEIKHWYGHFIRINSNQLVNRIHEARKGLRRKKGRPRKTAKIKLEK